MRSDELQTSSKASRYDESLVGSLAVSQASTAFGPPWNASSFGMSIDGWRERYQRSLDVAAFCEPITMNDGRHAPRYARVYGPWQRHSYASAPEPLAPAPPGTPARFGFAGATCPLPVQPRRFRWRHLARCCSWYQMGACQTTLPTLQGSTRQRSRRCQEHHPAPPHRATAIAAHFVALSVRPIEQRPLLQHVSSS